jgi:hypothetical protein
LLILNSLYAVYAVRASFAKSATKGRLFLHFGNELRAAMRAGEGNNAVSDPQRKDGLKSSEEETLFHPAKIFARRKLRGNALTER